MSNNLLHALSPLLLLCSLTCPPRRTSLAVIVWAKMLRAFIFLVTVIISDTLPGCSETANPAHKLEKMTVDNQVCLVCVCVTVCQKLQTCRVQRCAKTLRFKGRLVTVVASTRKSGTCW